MFDFRVSFLAVAFAGSVLSFEIAAAGFLPLFRIFCFNQTRSRPGPQLSILIR
jgi:hypothetical protein